MFDCVWSLCADSKSLSRLKASSLMRSLLRKGACRLRDAFGRLAGDEG
jgi:hypothetical protein